ncbi:TetR/AcrR family transcriptional regulator [Chitinimonas viridis]|uniref:TetR/AcrR family transcriptional regulator n=1 Tax=Chitinimonas viridis TaxID=664880 RepID=A0ABT8B371_9NEIS|nr:TetR/AcrR family transcriptional regulator [Chitinimonas viridis]MBL8509271.1 TetR family transcriptional regulator [Chitinimonas sp.]MDN3576684.1 TetR/AcrR family transcriptional regulator [Chitinimonas viridis]
MTTQEEKTRRAELIAAASRLFKEQGYERTTVRDLAQAVGMQSGSLFYHFRTKEEMLVAVMAAGIGDLTDRLEEALGQAKTPMDKLRTVCRVHLDTLLGDDKGALSVLLYEWPSLSDKARAELIKLRDSYERDWQQVLDEAAAAGLVHEDTRLLRKVLLGGLHWTIMWYRPEGGGTPSDLADRILELIIRKK